MMLKSRLFAILLVSLALLFSCSKKETTPTGPDPAGTPPPELSVSPATGIPGSMTNLTGLAADTTRADDYTVTVGGEAALFVIEDNGSISLFIPLWLDATNWSTPPASAQTVEVMLDTVVIGRATDALTVLPLPKAPGSTQKAVEALSEITGSLVALFDALPIQDSREAPVRAALLASLNGLISGGDSSLMAVIEGNSAYLDTTTYNLDLLDAMMASTGLLTAYENLSEKMSVLRDSSLTTTATSDGILICVGYDQDQLLACGLQIHVLLTDWTNQVLGETIKTWSAYVDLPVGLVGVSGRTVPYIAVTSAILNIVHFVFEKQIATLFPSHVTSFEFIMAKDTIGVDSLTTTKVVVSAENTPVAIELSDFIKLISAIGPLGSNRANEFFNSFSGYLGAATQFMLGIYASIIDQYETDNPGSDINTDLLYSPTFYYGPVVVNNPDLVMLLSSDPAIADVDEAAFEFRGHSFGTTMIRAEGRGPGDRSKMVNDNTLCFGCSYYGAAFGVSSPASNQKELTVGQHGELEVVITGLPDGLDADVLVIFPDGVTFRHLTETKTIEKLKPGMYEIQGNDRRSSSGVDYIADPESQFVTVESNETVTASVAYASIYGAIQLSILGLPDGIDADVLITGPNSFSRKMKQSGKVDSLREGDYLITAINITDPATGQEYIAAPPSQNISVYVDETSNATVDYSSISVNLYVGWFSVGDTTMWVSNARAQSARGDTVDTFGLPPGVTIFDTLSWVAYCTFQGGLDLETTGGFSYTADALNSEGASATATYSVQFNKAMKEIKIDAFATASAPSPGATEGSYGTSTNAYAAARLWPRLILEVVKSGSINAGLEVEWASSESEVDRGIASKSIQIGELWCGGTTRYPTHNLSAESGFDTIAVNSIYFTILTHAIANASGWANDTESNSGSAAISTSLRIKVIPLD